MPAKVQNAILSEKGEKKYTWNWESKGADRNLASLPCVHMIFSYVFSYLYVFFLLCVKNFTSVVLFMNWLIWTYEIWLYKGTSLTTWLMHPGSTNLFCLLCNWYLQLDKNAIIKLPQVFCEINKCQYFQKDLSILALVKVTSVH